jgi:hypothetical protein
MDKVNPGQNTNLLNILVIFLFIVVLFDRKVGSFVVKGKLITLL